jgi:hypothetical protein
VVVVPFVNVGNAKNIVEKLGVVVVPSVDMDTINIVVVYKKKVYKADLVDTKKIDV